MSNEANRRRQFVIDEINLHDSAGVSTLMRAMPQSSGIVIRAVSGSFKIDDVTLCCVGVTSISMWDVERAADDAALTRMVAAATRRAWSHAYVAVLKKGATQEAAVNAVENRHTIDLVTMQPYQEMSLR